ncbi:AzlD domain-containing protein [Acidovorax sp. SUPP1855]|uniref:AzlD domain-containing protein n=1 Tax=Acidovorax sp. SUPP1855 TaxID=431774 RepID=UPI0023DE3921|nr:AzlD domain-containing protein [Acidovorax sp. SUPP1855]GKS83029.1 AzlD domain-containing protein [Acidovorax sp. SUPP1855]
MSWSWVEPTIAILGLAAITVVSRAFFMIPERELPLPGWLKRGLKYAPLAALASVIAPEIFMAQGELIGTLQDARLPSVLCAAGYKICPV